MARGISKTKHIRRQRTNLRSSIHDEHGDTRYSGAMSRDRGRGSEHDQCNWSDPLMDIIVNNDIFLLF
jgi:hypothetical protein